MHGAAVVQRYQLVRADGGCRLDFCKVLEDDFGNLGIKEQLAMPVSTAALADCINRESTIMYDGQQMCLPFGPDHLIFKVGFDGAKELSDHELSALFNLGRDGGVGESKFHTAKAFLRTVQKVMFYTTMTYLPSIMAPQYRADWKSFVDSWFIQYEANAEIALGRRRLAGKY